VFRGNTVLKMATKSVFHFLFIFKNKVRRWCR